MHPVNEKPQQPHYTRAELEIAHYGREFLVETLHDARCISSHYQTSISGFGLYRTIYRDRMGTYPMSSCFVASELRWRASVLLIPPDSHGSNSRGVIVPL